MKKLIILLSLVLTSCYVQELPNGPNEHSGDIIIVPPPTGTVSQSLVGQTWKIFYYRVGPMGTVMTANDTLIFLTSSTYKYNGYQTTYHLTSTGSGYNLSLYETPWGNLSGTILSNNITQGQILGTKFVDISVGSSNTTEYYLWMNKI
jgi:hypothetical protein